MSVRIPTYSLIVTAVVFTVCVGLSSGSLAQQPQADAQAGKKSSVKTDKPQDDGGDKKADQPASDKPQATTNDIATIAKSIEAIAQALKKDETGDPDFALVFGIGSLLMRENVTDYQNQSNVLQATSLGRATPQLLAGVSFRTNVPSPFARFRGGASGALWQQRPWSGFVSLKFSPGSSQTISGYVLGVSFAVAHHLDVLAGYSLTPVNEPSPGLRAVAYQYVIDQQKAGHLTTFNPSALAANDANAFDGFSVADSTGKLIYVGNPLTVHYHGSTMVGVSVPVYFKSVFGK